MRGHDDWLHLRTLGLMDAKPPRAELPALLDFNAAATFLSVSLGTVRNLVGRGQLPTKKIGRRTLLRRSDLQRFVDAR